MEPARRDDLVMLLTRLAAHFWSERGEAQWRIVFEDYAEDLAGYPFDIVYDGIQLYRKKGKWWPKVAELVSEIEPLWAQRQVQRQRLAQIAGSKAEDAQETDNPAMDLVRKAAGRMGR